MEAAQAEFAGLLEGLTPKEAAKVGVTPLWSLNDLLAHMVGWHQVALKRVRELVEGEPVRPFDIQAMNRKFVREYQGVPWGLLVRELKKFQALLVKTARDLDEEHLKPESGPYFWLYHIGCAHTRAHMEPVRMWVGRLKDKRRKKEAKL